MTTKSLDAYLTSFNTDYSKIVGTMAPYHRFTVFCAKYFYYADSSEDIDEDFLKCMPDGTNDGGIDAVFANPVEEANELVIIQGKYYKKTTLTPLEFKQELTKIICTINDLNAHKVGKLNEDVKSAYFSATSDLEEGYSVRIDFCTLFRPTAKQLKELQQIASDIASESKFQIRLLPYEDIYRQVVSCETAADTVSEYTLTLDAPNNVLKYGGSVIVNISAQSLQTLYQVHKTRVLGRNLRYHIKSGSQAKDVDSAIAMTIKEEPENFWYLNNGILIACDSFVIEGTSLLLREFSIVNGGQTTYKIANAPDLSRDFFVQCKVVVAKGRDEKERGQFCLKIANATNSQKPIKQADLRANEPEQALLKKKLAGLGFYYATKAGDKPAKKVFKNFQIANLDRVGKVALAGVLLMPGTARSSPSKMFDHDIYDAIFDKPVPRVITDLLTLEYYFKSFQRAAILNADDWGLDDEDKLPSIKNGKAFYLACISFLAKIKAKVFTHSDVKIARDTGTDAIRQLFWKMGDMERIIATQSDSYKYAERIFIILTKKVMAPCCKQQRKVMKLGGGSFVLSNYYKKDDTFVDDVIEQLWSEYTDEDSKLKDAVSALLG